jgi:hypothetical protein
VKLDGYTCKKHDPNELVSEEKDGNTVYTATCVNCGEVCYERVVPASVVKFYTGKDFATTATTYYQAGKGTVEYDAQNGIIFGRESGNLQMLWHRSQLDMKFDTGSSQRTTQDIGEARFFVIRLRTSNTERTLKLNYSTTGHNSPTAIATEADPDKRGLDGVKGLEIGEEYATAIGYSTINFNIPSTAKAGEWVTYVVDLEAVVSEVHKKAEGAESIVVDTFYFDQNDKEGTLGVEYMAFVEGDWSDVGALVGSGEVINITANDGTFEKKTITAAK